MSSLRRKEWVAGLLIFAPLESAMIWWRLGAAPVAWIGLLWALVLAVTVGCLRSSRSRAAAANLAAVFIAIAIVEWLLYFLGPGNPYLLPDGVRFVGDLARPNYFIQMPSAGLGYQPRPGIRITAVKKRGDQIIYSARYSVGVDGLRARPPSAERPRSCLLMFGDSIAWGEGVDDEDTAAYQIGLLSAGAIRVANFAFTGYSAHQMLWQVSSGMVTRLSGCDSSMPGLAVYQTLPNNVGRVAGLRGWDKYGPRYILEPSGRIRYAGSFSLGDYVLHDSLFIPQALAEPLSRVNLYARILGRSRQPDEFDLERFCAIVKAAEDAIHASYPLLKFQVVVWPEPSDSDGDARSQTSKMFSALRSQGVSVINANEIVPAYRINPAATGIAGDGHPTVSTHLQIARYFVSREADTLLTHRRI